MKIVLKAVFGSIDKDGNLLSRNVKDKDAEYLAEVLDWTEIDGVRFDVRPENGGLRIEMGGGKLYPDITLNYTEKLNVVKQIVHKSEDAKFTSSVLNKFIRKCTKILNDEPCNRGKETPPNIVLIKDVDVIE